LVGLIGKCIFGSAKQMRLSKKSFIFAVLGRNRKDTNYDDAIFCSQALDI
jgi:hypothetical protein